MLNVVMNNVIKEEVFSTDSQSYSILKHAILNIGAVGGLICEIGTRRAGSTKIIIDSLVDRGDTNRTLVCVDPYGDIPFAEADNVIQHHDYTNVMRNETIPKLYEYAYGKLSNFIFFNMEDSEFFERYSDGVPVYFKQKSIINVYDLVFFDGPHDLANVRAETEFFLPRTVKGSVFVYDDTEGHYDHGIIEDTLLFCNGWKILEYSKRKRSYLKHE